MHVLKTLFPILLLCIVVSNQGFAAFEHRGDDEEWISGIAVSIDSRRTFEEKLSLAGIDVDMRGHAKKPLRIVGVNVLSGGEFEDSVLVVAANAELGGTFGKTLECYAANAKITGTFDGDVTLRAARITLDSTAIIRGDLFYSAASIDGLDRAGIAGTVTRLPLEKSEETWSEWREDFTEMVKTAAIASWILSLAGIVLAGILLHAILPEQINMVVDTIDDSPWAALGSGFVFFVAAPFLTTFALMTLIGVPTGLLAGLLYLAALLTGQIYSALWLGRKLAMKLGGAAPAAFYTPFILGAAAVWFLGIVPFVGWLAGFLALLLGLGGLWLTVWRAIRANRS
ncbi:hypothetical protein CHL67_04175 [Prosthecochloris sp. GSB1]|uniref:polymer-forming cytoskeletal protein n=1 Tax=Prosthecochloris sp. GSB1 TaxID=281093 RepID=UPI000B8CB1E0|nr:polymer-forming cytoskeletal protein [Prosthecochloris sp. GSB1]ASQ90228.1 hypothetical protein CHL67_04175 [Prosthecochloris sp. GSB1]